MTLMSYASGATDVPLLDETIGECLRRIASTFPDREALVDVPTDRRWTYAGRLADVDALSRGLLTTGVATGRLAHYKIPRPPSTSSR
jgi:fatty-acyl-CoA synthase